MGVWYFFNGTVLNCSLPAADDHIFWWHVLHNPTTETWTSQLSDSVSTKTQKRKISKNKDDWVEELNLFIIIINY